MKVKDLKSMLEEYIDILEQYEDEDVVDTKSNTYFINGNKFLGIKGYNGGYIDLENLEENIVRTDEEDSVYE